MSLNGLRYALSGHRWAWILFGSRENSKPEKCLKTPQNPQCPVHAVLDVLLFIYCLVSLLIIAAKYLLFVLEYM